MLAERNPQEFTPVEVLLYIWIGAFAYDEFGEFQDSGTLFYYADFWNLWDVGIIGVGLAYLISSTLLFMCYSIYDMNCLCAVGRSRRRGGKTTLGSCGRWLTLIEGIIGLAKDDKEIVNVSFDILSLEALFLVPRVFSLLSVLPFFGALVGDQSSSGSGGFALIS